MKILGNLLVAFALGLVPMAQAATSTTTDYSDLWWNPAESGWGAHITLQGDVAFMVLFVYDSQQQPRFFVASNLQRVDFSAFPGDTFGGGLFATQGPSFVGAFDPARVIPREVGSARVSFTTPGTAVLTYVVDGVSVTKQISRQGWRAPDVTGDFKGGLFATATATTCSLGLPSVSYPGSFTVTRTGETLTIESAFNPGFSDSGTCRYTGTAVPSGSQLSVPNGTYRCEFENTNVTTGTFQLTGIEVGPNGFSGRYRGVEGAACVHAGYFGGMRRGYEIVVPPAEDPRAY